MNYKKRIPILNIELKEFVRENGFALDEPMGAYTRKYSHESGAYGVVTVTDEKISYVLRNKDGYVLCESPSRGIPFSNNKEFIDAVRSADITINLELDNNWIDHAP